MEIKIEIDRADTERWLNWDGELDDKTVDELAEKYCKALTAEMSKLNKDADVTVEWASGLASGYRITVQGVDDFEDEYNLLEELELDYQSTGDILARFDWA